MSSATTAVVIVVVVIVIALIIAVMTMGRRKRLQERFGPEYDRAVSEQDSRLRAEAELAGRQRRVRRLDIRPLSETVRQRYLADWQAIQEQFVDAPEEAVTNAYALVTEVMRERGYPATDDEQAMADLSVDHASTVGHFRSAQEITRNVAHGSGDTEDLRQAFLHYRDLFADLLGDQPAELGLQLRAARAAAPAGEPGEEHELVPIPTDSSGLPVAATPAHASDDPLWQLGR
jgi:hypothetical protein